MAEELFEILPSGAIRKLHFTDFGCYCPDCTCGCLGGDHSGGYGDKQADNRGGNDMPG